MRNAVHLAGPSGAKLKTDFFKVWHRERTGYWALTTANDGGSKISTICASTPVNGRQHLHGPTLPQPIIETTAGDTDLASPTRTRVTGAARLGRTEGPIWPSPTKRA